MYCWEASIGTLRGAIEDETVRRLFMGIGTLDVCLKLYLKALMVYRNGAGKKVHGFSSRSCSGGFAWNNTETLSTDFGKGGLFIYWLQGDRRMWKSGGWDRWGSLRVFDGRMENGNDCKAS